jgi:hypothetical protein
MSHELKSVLVGMVVPFVGVLSGILAFGGSETQVLGFPAVFAWLFLWMPLTALCLQLAWKIDEPHFQDEEVAS